MQKLITILLLSVCFGAFAQPRSLRKATDAEVATGADVFGFVSPWQIFFVLTNGIDGSGLTNVNAAFLGGIAASEFDYASNYARLSGTVVTNPLVPVWGDAAELTNSFDYGNTPISRALLGDTNCAYYCNLVGITNSIDRGAVFEAISWLAVGGIYDDLTDAFFLHGDLGNSPSQVVSFFGRTNAAISNVVASPFGLEFNGSNSGITFTNSEWPQTNTMVVEFRPRNLHTLAAGADQLRGILWLGDGTGANGFGMSGDLAVVASIKTNSVQGVWTTCYFQNQPAGTHLIANGCRQTWAIGWQNSTRLTTAWTGGSPATQVGANTYETVTPMTHLYLGMDEGATKRFYGGIRTAWLFDKVLSATEVRYVERAMVALHKPGPARPLTVFVGDSFAIDSANTNGDNYSLNGGGFPVRWLQSQQRTNNFLRWNVSANGKQISAFVSGTNAFHFTNTLSILQPWSLSSEVQVKCSLGANDLLSSIATATSVAGLSNISMMCGTYGAKLDMLTLRCVGTNNTSPPDLWWTENTETNLNYWVYGHPQYFRKIYPVDQWFTRSLMATNLLLSRDGLHLTPMGNEYLARKLWEFDLGNDTVVGYASNGVPAAAAAPFGGLKLLSRTATPTADEIEPGGSILWSSNGVFHVSSTVDGAIASAISLVGMTTNINVLLEDSTTNQLQFTSGILTGVVPLP